MSPYDGPITDAHVHFWDPERNDHPWLRPDVLIPFRYGDYTAIKKRYLPYDLRTDSAGHDVRSAIYIETEWNPQDPIGEMEYASSLAAAYPWPNALVGAVRLDRPDAAELIARIAEFPLARGIRHKPGGPASPAERSAGRRTLMSDSTWRNGYRELARHGLHFELQTPWWNLDEARDLAAKMPDVPMVLNHAGLPGDRGDDALAAWGDAIEGLAAEPNVLIKISGLGDPGEAWTPERNARIVRRAIEAFGASRAMFASNFPVDRLCATYDEIYAGFKQLTADLSPHEQQDLFHANAVRLYRPVGA
ncbi:MAG: amidohydrolase family protein [Streptosporangiales bacterium]|nr:amidohydrolase family protein [Streptosporangiales bacterium]